ncbi:MAG: hypothetical protein ABSD49_06270 [Candidatus Bathyarchaeia archaeon]
MSQFSFRLIATILEKDRQRILMGGSIKGDQAYAEATWNERGNGRS